tara:strand:+ start:131 stop:892 length:762 start_codon:yes stop_codon:yes gene_type:complete
MTNSPTVRKITPNNYGWYEYDLNEHELAHIWNCIQNKGDRNNETLAGNLSNSFLLTDEDDAFFNNTLQSLVATYNNNFRDMGSTVPITNLYPYCLHSWWVNYQKKHEFNPIHDHHGVFSFVIWLKIPTDHAEQNRNNITNSPRKSTFSFSYQTTIGQQAQFNYDLSSKNEGTMLFFPSTLQHQVYPFYNSDEDRITVSGNIALNTEADNYDQSMEKNSREDLSSTLEKNNPWGMVDNDSNHKDSSRIVKQIWV